VDLLLPIYLAALQSEDLRLQNVCVRNFVLIVGSLPAATVRSVVIPKVSDLITTAKAGEIVQSCIETLRVCLGLVEHDDFAVIVMPKIGSAWKKGGSPQIARALPDLLEALEPSIEIVMREVVPLIGIVLGMIGVDSQSQLRLIAIGQRAFLRVIEERMLEGGGGEGEEGRGKKELEALPERLEEPKVLEIPRAKPVRKVIEHVEKGGEKKRPNWSAVFKKQEGGGGGGEEESSAFDLPSPVPGITGDDELWFNTGQTQEEIDAEVVNGILGDPPLVNRR
jgi:hypothetical protein